MENFVGYLKLIWGMVVLIMLVSLGLGNVIDIFVFFKMKCLFIRF